MTFIADAMSILSQRSDRETWQDTPRNPALPVPQYCMNSLQSFRLEYRYQGRWPEGKHQIMDRSLQGQWGT